MLVIGCIIGIEIVFVQVFEKLVEHSWPVNADLRYKSSTDPKN